MTVPILQPPIHRWECPSCNRRHITRTAAVTSELHRCPAQKGMIVPFVEVTGTDLRPGMRHVLIERGDYEGTEVGVRHDGEGRAIMAVHTERADGSHDTHVFAPAAKGKAILE